MCNVYALYSRVAQLESKWYNPFTWNRWIVMIYNGTQTDIIRVRATNESSARLKAQKELQEQNHIYTS